MIKIDVSLGVGQSTSLSNWDEKSASFRYENWEQGGKWNTKFQYL